MFFDKRFLLSFLLLSQAFALPAHAGHPVAPPAQQDEMPPCSTAPGETTDSDVVGSVAVTNTVGGQKATETMPLKKVEGPTFHGSVSTRGFNKY